MGNEYYIFDITKRVKAKITDDLIEVYCGKDCIGLIVINEEDNHFKLEEERDDKFYDQNRNQLQYSEDCDIE